MTSFCISILNKKVGKPYNATDARHVDFPKFGEGPEGVPLWWYALVVSYRILNTKVSCYRPSIQTRKVSVAVIPHF